jgi:CheY-like chemotaxis protein
MLQKLNEEIVLCHWKAEDCARQAKSAANDALRLYWLRHEQKWLELARSHELQQRLALFINERDRRKNDEARALGHVSAGHVNAAQVNADGAAAATAWVELPEPGKTAIDVKPLQDELIAIVDDEKWARGGLSTLIESRGHRAAAFASAEHYLASDVKENTACLILDVHLLGMSGPDLQAHLIADGCCPPTVFVTGRFEPHMQKRVIGAGALGYLTKPCNEQALFDCIEKALGTMR